MGLEEEYHRALAENIVKELNQPKYRRESTLRGRAPSRDSTKSARRVTCCLMICGKGGGGNGRISTVILRH